MFCIVLEAATGGNSGLQLRLCGALFAPESPCSCTKHKYCHGHNMCIKAAGKPRTTKCHCVFHTGLQASSMSSLVYTEIRMFPRTRSSTLLPLWAGSGSERHATNSAPSSSPQLLSVVRLACFRTTFWRLYNFTACFNGSQTTCTVPFCRAFVVKHKADAGQVGRHRLEHSY